ncbi:MAG TPA: ADP-dependent glucokinase/phosphofructokinase [Anaerovoracaceae bacterium]|nr:ADP-dependent glucokinase/phosphofructokinase [Anaerovoracaceae bacterium]
MKEKIILGLGNNIDYEIIWNAKVLEDLIIRYDIRDIEISAGIEINSERDLVVSILGFLKTGTGGERFVSSPDIIEKFAGYFKYKITMGGTSVRAAAAMRKLGYISALHLVTVNDHVRRLIPKGCPYVCSAKEDSLYPHLIVQFVRGASVSAGSIDIHAGRSNRIIYVNDKDSVEMTLNEDFADLVKDAEVLLISGFNAMRDKTLLGERLQTLLKIMSALPEDAYVFFEDACFHDASLSKQVRDALMERIDIYSLNEDELQDHLGRKPDLLDPGGMAAALADIRRLIPVPVIVVHTGCWALAYGKDALLFEKALKGGITMAGARFRFGDDFTAVDYFETEKSDLQKEGEVFADGINRMLGEEVCCLACIQAEEINATTVGLGDAFVGGFLPALIK